MSDVDIISHSLAQTHRLGARLGNLLEPGDLLLLRGPLGSGKTALTQGIAQGLGISATVNSPTFVLVRDLMGRLPLHHMDFYRLARPTEPWDLGLDEYLNDNGVTVIEWPERVAGLPETRLDITLKIVSETKRGVVFAPRGERYERLISAFCREAFGV